MVSSEHSTAVSGKWAWHKHLDGIYSD